MYVDLYSFIIRTSRHGNFIYRMNYDADGCPHVGGDSRKSCACMKVSQICILAVLPVTILFVMIRVQLEPDCSTHFIWTVLPNIRLTIFGNE